MKAYYQDPYVTIYHGDCLKVLAELPAESVQCCVTSPPYWGLRKYSGEQEMLWGDDHCEHEWKLERTERLNSQGGKAIKQDTNAGSRVSQYQDRATYSQFCLKCNAWRGAYGLEPTPELYVEHTIEFLRAIRRVLRPDGVAMINLGDSYYGGKGQSNYAFQERRESPNLHGAQHNIASLYETRPSDLPQKGLKPKDLCLIPFRVALAAQADKEPITLIKDRTWAAWFAGIIDGEGTIGIHRTDRGDWIQVTPYITAKMSDIEALEQMATLTKTGGARMNNDADTRDSRGIRTTRNSYTWRVEGEQAIQIIRDIYPWLTIKERQARIANELWEVVQAKKSDRGNGRLRLGEMEYRDQLWQMMKGCNQREWQGDVPFPAPPQNYIDYSWYVRSIIIWSKNNPMPSSVKDRPTASHEYILLLTRSAKYYWDIDAVREQISESYAADKRPHGVLRQRFYPNSKYVKAGMMEHDSSPFPSGEKADGRNIRTVWEFNEDDEQGDKVYKVLQGCPIHSPLLHPDILKMLQDGEPQDCLLTHTLDRYSRLVPVLSFSLLSKLYHTNGGVHLSSLGFHHHATECGQTLESIGDNRMLSLCCPDGGHKYGHQKVSHTKHIQKSDGSLFCSSDYSHQSDELTATLRNREIRKTVSLIVTNDSVFLLCPDRIARILQSLGCICSYNNYTTSHFPLQDVWKFPTQPYAQCHFAVFPEELPRRCILAASKQGDIVLDPFSGVGTTGLVAKQLGRKAILIDTSEDYCRMAQHRIEQVPIPMQV